MVSSPEPILFDRDPQTGQTVPTSCEALPEGFFTNHPLSGSLPGDIDGLLRIAVDYVALAYEQANTGRRHLYESLTNDALIKASLALELSLRNRLSPGNRVPLVELSDQGLATDLLPASNADAWV